MSNQNKYPHLDCSMQSLPADYEPKKFGYSQSEYEAMKGTKSDPRPEKLVWQDCKPNPSNFLRTLGNVKLQQTNKGWYHIWKDGLKIYSGCLENCRIVAENNQ